MDRKTERKLTLSRENMLVFYPCLIGRRNAKVEKGENESCMSIRETKSHVLLGSINNWVVNPLWKAFLILWSAIIPPIEEEKLIKYKRAMHCETQVMERSPKAP